MSAGSGGAGLSKAIGWISSRLSPPTPKTISATENRQRLDATRKAIDDATRPERERIMKQYQRRGLPPTTAHPTKPSAANPAATPSQQPRRSERISSAGSTTATPIAVPREVTRNRQVPQSSTNSTTSSCISSPDLLQQTAGTLNFDDDDDDDGGGGKIAALPPPLPRLSNISEEGTHAAEEEGSGTDTGNIDCCAFELCLGGSLNSDNFVMCMECLRQCHPECAEDFYLQTPCKDGRLPMTAFTKDARKRCKARQLAVLANQLTFDNDDTNVTVIPTTAFSTSVYCLQCKAKIVNRRSATKTNKKKSSASTTAAVVSAPKKKVVTPTLPDSIRMELRRAISFYCRSLVFQGKTTSTDNCKTLMAKNFYGDRLQQKMGAVEMLLKGVGPFKDLYDEYEGDNGKERVLKPWLSGVATPVHYVPGVHFTAETIAQVSKDGNRKVTGQTLWRESLQTVKFGKKAISFISNLDVCDYDPSTFAVTVIKSGHTMRDVFEEINTMMLAWTAAEAKRLANTKKAEIDEWTKDDDVDDAGDIETSSRFPGFFSFFLFGPTRQGAMYSSLWRRGEDSDMDASAKAAGSRASMKDGGRNKSQQKRTAAELERERKKRREGDAKYREFRMKVDTATVAQTKDEMTAARFDSEMARLSKLIDTETSTSELKMRRQERCTDPDRVSRYEDEIDQHMENIEKYRGQLEGLEQKTQQSNGHVDALLGNEEKSESEEDDADSDN